MGPFNNDIKNIVLQLLWKYNIVGVCEQYRDNCRTYHSMRYVNVFDKHYNWRNLTRQSYINLTIINQYHKRVGKISKNY